VEAGAEESLLRHYVPSLGILWSPSRDWCFLTARVVSMYETHGKRGSAAAVLHIAALGQLRSPMRIQPPYATTILLCHL
jgi:hypothetical protein